MCLLYRPAEPGVPSAIRGQSVVVFFLFSILCYIFSNPTTVTHCINNGWILISNDRIDLPNMTGFFKVVLLPLWWQKNRTK